MAIEESGADYLRRLKADAEQPLVPPFHPPVPTAESDPPTASQNPPERRRSPRYKCEGSAEFRVGGTDVRTWGTFTDLSVHGCYIEMTATFPVGAMVDLVLELNGSRVSVKGEVRVSYPFLGIGVAFRDVTPEAARILQSMIACLIVRERGSSSPSSDETNAPISIPVIASPAEALQAIANFFETHSVLAKYEFQHLIRKSQTQLR
jgi:hypothetical protein